MRALVAKLVAARKDLMPQIEALAGPVQLPLEPLEQPEENTTP